MGKENISIICDERTIEDKNLGIGKDSEKWDQRPFYLLNKVLSNSKNVRYIPIESIGEYDFKEDEKIFLHLDMGTHPERYSHAINLTVPNNITLFNRNITDITKNYTESIYVGMGGPTRLCWKSNIKKHT